MRTKKPPAGAAEPASDEPTAGQDAERIAAIRGLIKDHPDAPPSLIGHLISTGQSAEQAAAALTAYASTGRWSSPFGGCNWGE